MKPRGLDRTGSIALTAIVISAVVGCSFFSIRSDQPADSTSFHSTALGSSDGEPTPVEIATDIAGIAEPTAPETTQPQAKEAPQASDKSARAEPAKLAAQSAQATQLAPAPRTPQAVREVHGSKQSERYKVRRGDTLMKISFAKYGNLYRWREIYDLNQNVIHNFNVLTPGTVLTIHGVEYVVIEKNGLPYLIRRHDTLGSISKVLYGTPKHWRDLWQNNRLLIRDPNKIYAGFTLYYRTNLKVGR